MPRRWRNAPVASKRGKPWSLPVVPKAIPRGTRYQASPGEWNSWAKISYAVGDGRYYQYEVVAAAAISTANGAASKFSLRLELRAGELTILPEIAETDPGE